MNASKIKCVAFDADNTLYETRQAAQVADMEAMKLLAQALSANSHELDNSPSPETLYGEFKTIVQGIKNSPDPKIRHRRYSYGVLAKNHGIKDPATPEKMLEALEVKLMQELKLVPGIKEILKNLSLKKINLIVITEDGRPRTLKKLETLGLKEFFSEIITSDDVGIMKPSPKYYESLLKKFKPEEILVVGDNEEKDLLIPQKLGMKTILVEKPEDLLKIQIS